MRAGVLASGIAKDITDERFVVLDELNAEMRWDSLEGVGETIPNDCFFVRNHAPTPVLDEDCWRLKVFGDALGSRPTAGEAIEFDYDDLLSLPSRSVTSVIECAGNGRTLFA